jgi:hypothetical protein
MAGKGITTALSQWLFFQPALFYLFLKCFLLSMKPGCSSLLLPALSLHILLIINLAEYTIMHMPMIAVINYWPGDLSSFNILASPSCAPPKTHQTIFQ